MEIEGASSPGSLSSPPHSPEQGTPNSTARVSGVGVAANANALTSTPTPAATSTSTTSTPRLTASGQPRKKPGPKPKPKDPNAIEEKKVRRPRKPAEPKDPASAPVPRKRRTKASIEAANAAAAAANAAAAAAAAAAANAAPIAVAPSPAPAATPTPAPVKEESAPVQHSPAPQTAQPASVFQADPSAVTQAPRVLSNPEPSSSLHSNPNLSHINVAPTTPRPASSGQRYDPIRGGMFESKPQAASVPPISPPLNRASASPSITSLIDPPSVANTTYQQTARLQQAASVTSAPVSPAVPPARPGSLFPLQDSQSQQQVQQTHQHSAQSAGFTPMDIDSEPAPKASVPMKKSDSSAGTPSNSNAPTPPVKPARQKEAPPPLPTGSGLLSGTPFGPVAGTNGSSEPTGVNIWITIPLKGRENVTLNFAQEVEKRYGFSALQPRIAARKERQRQITAAGAALEKAAGTGSADDMSLDLSEPDSNAEMGGMDDEASAGGNGVKKRRKRKQEDYDKDDDFIDDTELAWEQQALMAKDGFFVYSGPLVTEEKPAVERADGTVRRGRGRGRGGTVRGETSGRGRGRGGGPGSRGGSTVRKPRVTKADRAMMEQEKLEREKLAATIAAKQPIAGYAGASGAM